MAEVKRDWRVHKFGGTSLASAERIGAVVEIALAESGQKKALVVSAMGGVTDGLLGMLEKASARDEGYRDELQALKERHLATLEELVGEGASMASVIEGDFRDIEDVLRATWLLGKSSQTARELVAGYGEVWSAQLVAAALKARGVAARWLDARGVLIADSGQMGPVIDWEASWKNLDDWLAREQADIAVITGFIASTSEGVPTTLGRNGSDYSASIFGALLGAQSVTIWTDVDGVLSADPRLVPDAQILDELSYEEAMELAYFGAAVIHPKAMAPAVENDIPLWIRNTFNPDAVGTKIHGEATADTTVKGLAAIDSMALCNLEGAGMMGVPGIASRLFGALRSEGISVVMISQGSSEYSICFAVPDDQAQAVQEVVEREFFAEFHHAQLQRIEVTRGCSVLAVVGDGMSGVPGVAAKFFGALGKAGVSIRAIAQGASQRNITAVVAGADRVKALRAVHSGFYLSSQTLSVGLIGPGNVGAVLLDQLAGEVKRLARKEGIDLRVRAIAGREKMVLSDGAIELGQWREAFGAAQESADLERFAGHVKAAHYPHGVIIDCTASAAVARMHGDWIEEGIHVVTPNKKGCAGPLSDYHRIRESSRRTKTHYLYETTVGAGLPILKTLADIRETGDRVRQVEGILSGTLAYLFNRFDGTTPFSQIVAEAHKKGFTEPDPRDDLSGMDVARKLTILGREMGLDLKIEEVEVRGLVPEELVELSVDEFMGRLHELDDEMAGLFEEASQDGEVLRYVGRVNREGEASVGVERYGSDHPFAGLKLTDNIVQFATERYDENPLIVQGPGAGPAVTAGGIFADLLRLAAYVGERP